MRNAVYLKRQLNNFKLLGYKVLATLIKGSVPQNLNRFNKCVILKENKFTGANHRLISDLTLLFKTNSDAQTVH
jgi:hypothetical protein